MSNRQKRILWAVAVFSFVFNACCFGVCKWNDREMEKDGIYIEKILEGGGR